jgi:acetoin utilization deacetylase AcuC-like enzyme
MSTALITHPDALLHHTPPGHPEQVARLQRILAVLDAPAFANLRREPAPMADESAVLRCHSATYVAQVRAAIPVQGTAQLDADTHVSPMSLTAALRSVGGACHAVDLVLGDAVANAFVAMRPPGHHAETATSMGFCLFGTVAIAAKYALDHHGLSRVAVVDFDVHHGNGTQDLLWDELRVLFATSQQMPLWPGSGSVDERGAHNNILNVPLPPGCTSAVFRAAYTQSILPQVAAFKPELVLISAGFDAHRDDPLAQLELVEDDFVWITQQLCDIADASANGRVVSILEGGYNLDALAASVAAHITVLMERGA